jgi:hypothetical protein
VTSRRVIVTREALTVWVGYVQMQALSQEWEAAPYDIEVPIMDTVEVLNSIYVGPDETASTTMELLRHAHVKAYGLADDEQQSDFCLTNWPTYFGRTGAASGQWANASVNPGFFYNAESDDRMTYADAIDIILSPHGRLSQVGTRWLILRSGKTDATELYAPASDGAPTWEPFGNQVVMADISHAIAGSSNNQSVLPAPSKVSYKYVPEEGMTSYDGNSIYEWEKENIKSNDASGYFDFVWVNSYEDMGRVRYLIIPPNNLKQPVTTEHHVLRYSWRNRNGVVARIAGPTITAYNPNTDQWLQPCWSQPIEFTTDAGWICKKAQAYNMNRQLTVQPIQDSSSLLVDKWDIVADILTMKINRMVTSSLLYALKIQRKIQWGNMVKSADYSDGEGNRTYYIQPFTQVFWSPVPWADGVNPQKVLNKNLTWDNCSTFMWPAASMDSHMIPDESFNGGLTFALPGRGYIAVRIFAMGWPINGDTQFRNETDTGANANSWYTVSDFKISNEAWNLGSRKLIEWDEDSYNEINNTYSDGADEETATFKTRAGEEVTARTYLTPERGFDDSQTLVTDPREMLDIDAVQVTAADGIPGVTRFALFQFDGKTYFPAAVGMKARDNTVSLKLIRTL